MKRYKRYLFALLLVPAFVLTACSHEAADDEANTEEDTAMVEDTETAVLEEVDAEGTQVLQYETDPERVGKSLTVETGTCSAGSPSVNREGAYLCLSSNGTSYDPCFVAGDTAVMCEPQPSFESPGTILTLSRDLPAAKGELATEPVVWYMQLEDKTTCSILTKTFSLSGETGTFFCNKKNTYIFGEPTKNDSGFWTVQKGVTNDFSTVFETEPEAVNVIEAWTY